jgi:HSP20 family protein
MALTMMRDPLVADFRLMDDLFGRMFGNVNRVTGFIPTLDVHETEDEYLVFVDLPGVKSEDVVVELTDRVLTISGSRTPVESGEVRRSERPFGSFVRRLTLPKGVDSDKVEAEYKEGVLELRIPKRAEAKPKKIAIGGTSQEAIEQ